MRILIIAPGSRGDIQPLVALGKGLQDAGDKVRVVTHRNYETLVGSHGLEFCAIELDIQQVIQEEKMRQLLESGNLLTSMAQMSQELKRSAVNLAERSLEACKGMDMIIAGIGGLFVGLALAEKTGLPLVQAHNVPITPTGAFPGALLPRVAKPLYRTSHHISRQILWQAYRPADKLVRRQVLGLPATSLLGPFASARLRSAPILYGISSSVLAPPDDWNYERIHITGYWSLEPSEQWHPPTDLMQFLDNGPPPVYIGFGSMSNRKPEETADLVLQAIRHTGERAIIFSGWAGLQKADLPDSVLMVDSVPHSWLFSRVRAVVHHGGAGTTAAGLNAGVPSIIVPYHGDQPFWALRVASLGVGPAPIPRSRLTSESLAEALQITRNDRLMQQRAAALGASIRAEDGIEKAVVIIQQLGG